MPAISDCEVCACPCPQLTRPHGADRTTSVWKPLRGPLRDWPLALCDLSSVLADDTLEADNVFTNRVVESMQVHYAETQKWYYLQDQEPSELLIFQQADSAKGKNSGMSDTALC